MQKKVVIIDDDIDSVEVIAQIIEPEGYDVVKVTDTTSVEDIMEKQPDVVVVDDWLLQQQSGSDICQEIKNDPATAHVKVVLISAHAGLPELAEECQADAFIEKPFDIQTMEDVIAKQVSGSGNGE